MATSMKIYREIAGRYGVDTTNDEAVDDFYTEGWKTLTPDERIVIITELLECDGDAEPLDEDELKTLNAMIAARREESTRSLEDVRADLEKKRHRRGNSVGRVRS